MQTARRHAILLSFLAALVVTGCRKPVASDANVSTAVQTRLSGDSALSSESIQPSVRAGVVTLSGNVSSETARILAGNDAAQVPGVRTVLNNLTVQNAGNFSPQLPQQNLPPQQTFPAQTPVTISTAPTRVRTLPGKPTAAVERQKTVSQPNAAAPSPSIAERLPQQPSAPPPPAFRNVNLPSGTSLPVRITQTLDSASTQQGQSFSGTIASDVMVDGLVAIPQGSAVSGRVDAVQEAGHFSGNSLLSIEVTSISRRGERLPVTTEPFTKQGAGRGKNTAVKTGAGAAAGAILGGIFGGGKGAAIGAAAGGGTGAGINAVTRGQQVQIPSESLVSFRLANSISIRVREDARPSANDDSRPAVQVDQQPPPDQPVQNDQDHPTLHRHPPTR